MPAFKIRLTASQVDDLKLVCALGPVALRKVSAALERCTNVLRPSAIEAIIAEETSATAAPAIKRVLFGLATASRRTFSPITEILESTANFAFERWDEDTKRQWHDCQPEIESLLKSAVISLTAKAIDLSLDFDKLYIKSRVLTDVRPVFDDARSDVVAAAVTQTLRIDYITNAGEEETLSLALDVKDLRQLSEECDRALRKTAVSKNLMDKLVPTLVGGEDADE